MAERIELDDVEHLAAGAVGAPGRRTFLIQARQDATQLTVLLEKEQVAILAREAIQLCERLDADVPGDREATVPEQSAQVQPPADPLFRARTIGLGYDPDRRRILIELRELGDDAEEEDDDALDDEAGSEGWVARLYATRAQVKAMAHVGRRSVSAGRPTCDLCGFPMDPDGHVCPRWN